MTSRFGLLVGLAALAVGCAGPAITTEHRTDGIYHLKCQTTLQVCLNRAEVLCNRNHYAVLRAFDVHERKGDSVYPDDYRSSEAYVRCGMRATWGDENNALRAEALCPAPPPPQTTPPPSSSRACAPGASQACVGPAGCKGGQVCAPDGAGFGPCDCGPAPAP